MEKFFNTAGPIKKNLHYFISSFDRIDYEDIENLINQQKYFVLHAPRQTGKTTALFEMMERINKEGVYDCCYVNIEPAQASRGNIDRGIRTICDCISDSVSLYLKNDSLSEWLLSAKKTMESEKLLLSMLKHWASNNKKPIVLFLDEVDTLVGDTLISLLRQLRAGYNQRPEAFIQSAILCGVRDIRDYRIHTKNNEIITGGSAFNIKVKSLTIEKFSAAECKKLFNQHTEQTDQIFEDDIYNKLWADTKGQPWLVNALAYEMTYESKELRKDRTINITLNHYNQAREALIQSRATHLDQLTDKLTEERVRRVIAPLLSSEGLSAEQFNERDIEYVIDLGLITYYQGKRIEISNDIYKEIIPRELTLGMQSSIVNQEQEWYICEDNTLDIKKLIKAFQQFFRENADSWIEKFDYREAGPQLLLQAFLQRIINGGGRINREYGLGRKRTDIFIEWPLDKNKGFFGEKIQRIVIETKILYSNLEKTIEKGLYQTLEYGTIVGADEHHLIIFNRSKDTSWDEKIWYIKKRHNKKSVDVYGS